MALPSSSWTVKQQCTQANLSLKRLGGFVCLLLFFKAHAATTNQYILWLVYQILPKIKDLKCRYSKQTHIAISLVEAVENYFCSYRIPQGFFPDIFPPESQPEKNITLRSTTFFFFSFYRYKISSSESQPTTLSKKFWAKCPSLP